MLMSSAMMPMTTSSSTSVNAQGAVKHRSGCRLDAEVVCKLDIVSPPENHSLTPLLFALHFANISAHTNFASIAAAMNTATATPVRSFGRRMNCEPPVGLVTGDLPAVRFV